MTLSPKISVLVPVHNGERHLAECLDSILKQDFRDMEILISDDDSTDQSRELIKQYAARDARIRWWKNPQRVGLTANSNICLRAAAGEYVKYVHQDDLLLSVSSVRKLATALDENPSAVLAGSQPHLTGSKSKPIILSTHSRLYAGKEMVVTCFERNNNLIGQPTLTLFRKDNARRGFDERFTDSMDFEMWCHLLEQGDFVYQAEPLATWRVHATHQTARTRINGVSDHESLLLMETYYAKAWLRELATERMLFTQIYYLRKKHGPKALPLTATMMSQLTPGRYRMWWLKHKSSSPLIKISKHLLPS